MLRRTVGLWSMVIVMVGACDKLVLPDLIDGSEVACGAYAGPDCNDLLEIGLDAVAVGRGDEPLAIGVDRACPPNARCVPSALGGDTAAVVVLWADGTIGWATIPLAPDWPASAPGPATVMLDRPPAHLLELVGAGDAVGMVAVGQRSWAQPA